MLALVVPAKSKGEFRGSRSRSSSRAQEARTGKQRLAHSLFERKKRVYSTWPLLVLLGQIPNQFSNVTHHRPGVEPGPVARVVKLGRQRSYRWTTDALCGWIRGEENRLHKYIVNLEKTPKRSTKAQVIN